MRDDLRWNPQALSYHHASTVILTYLCEFKRITTCNRRTTQPTHRHALLQYQITVNTTHAAGTSRGSVGFVDFLIFRPLWIVHSVGYCLSPSSGIVLDIKTFLELLWSWLSMFLPSLRLALLLLYRSHASNQHALPSYTTVYIIQHSLKSVICLTNAVEALHTDTYSCIHMIKNKSSIHIA